MRTVKKRRRRRDAPQRTDVQHERQRGGAAPSPPAQRLREHEPRQVHHLRVSSKSSLGDERRGEGKREKPPREREVRPRRREGRPRAREQRRRHGILARHAKNSGGVTPGSSIERFSPRVRDVPRPVAPPPTFLHDVDELIDVERVAHRRATARSTAKATRV